MENRVIIWDENTRTSKVKSAAQIVKENEEFNNMFEKGRGEMSDTKTDEAVKESIKEDDFQALLAKKKLEKERKTDTAVDMRPIVSLKIGVVGSGHAGSKLAEVMYKLGYSTVCINSARQDLELLDIPPDNKLHMNYSIGGGGSGKTLDVGKAAIDDSLDAVRSFVAEKLNGSDVYLAAFSLGGGSGSGSAETLVNLLNEFGKPVIVLCALPGGFDDTQSKYNAIQTLSKLSDQASTGKINSLILIDNAQLEKQFVGLSQTEFWKIANSAIVEPFHMFNSMSARPTKHEALDSADFSVALLESGGCTVFGSHKIPKEQYGQNDLGLVENIVDNLEKSLMADGFDLKDAQRVGILIMGSARVLSTIPYTNLSFIFKYISEEFASAASFKGIYEVATDTDDITVHFMFSGLGLPRSRVDDLKTEAKKSMDTLNAKKNEVANKMSVGLEVEKNPSAANTMMSQIKKNKSALGKLLGSNSGSKTVIDRRR